MKGPKTKKDMNPVRNQKFMNYKLIITNGITGIKVGAREEINF